MLRKGVYSNLRDLTLPLNVSPWGEEPQLLVLASSTGQNVCYLQRTVWNVLDRRNCLPSVVDLSEA